MDIQMTIKGYFRVKQYLAFCLFLFLFLFFLNTLTYSQIVNIQPFLRSKAPEGFSLTFKGAVEWKTGNTDLIKTDLGLAGRYKYANHLILLLTKGSYAEKKSDKFINKTFNHLRYRYQFTSFIGFEFFSQYEFDEFRRIDQRILAGLGPRITPVSHDIIEISIGSAYMYEFNKNREGNFADSGDKTYHHRWSSYLNLDINLGKQFNFFSTIYYQPRFGEFSDYRLLNDNSLVIKVNSWLSIVNKFVVNYNSRPLDGVKSLDTSFSSGFQISIIPSKN